MAGPHDMVDKILLFRVRIIEKLAFCVKKNAVQYVGFWDCALVEGVWLFSEVKIRVVLIGFGEGNSLQMGICG
jgi:hypothetical protein